MAPESPALARVPGHAGGSGVSVFVVCMATLFLPSKVNSNVQFFHVLRGGLVLAAVACACACSSSSSGINGPACGQGEFKLTGTLAGSTVNASYTSVNYAFDQITNPSTLDASFGSGGALHLQWNGIVGNGNTAPATGTLTMAAADPQGGTKFCVGSGSQVEPLDSGAAFTLTALTNCSTAAVVSGQISGCYGDLHR